MPPRTAAAIGSAANSYEILAKLAEGGMAEIFLARGASAAGVVRGVVLKRVRKERAGEKSMVEMFLDEARLAAQLQHPNIAQVYDVGQLEQSYFFTMEYVHGETVRAILQRSVERGANIPLGCVLAIVVGAAQGLSHAHDRCGLDGRPLGIVHRDVSPANLMVSFDGIVKLMDFGVAKSANRDNVTASGTVKGKIAYLSPEQCKGAQLDRRSDVFSLGIVMWEMLTARRLFKRESDFETMTAIATESAPPPSSLRGDVPPGLDAIVARALANDPAKRFQTATDLIVAIEEFAERSAIAVSTSALGRLLVDLFGRRPEPWTELDETTETTLTNAATATITHTLELGPAEEAVPQISPSDEEMPTNVQDRITNVLQAPRKATVPYPIVAPAVLVPPTPSALPALPDVARPLYRAPVENAPPTPSKFRWRRFALIVAATIAVGVILGIVTPAADEEPEKPKPTPVPITTLVPTPAPEQVAGTPPEQVATPPDPQPSPAAVASDLDLLEPPEPDPDPTPSKKRAATKPKTVAAARDPVEDLKALYRAGELAQVVIACTKHEVDKKNAAVCTLAACRLKDTNSARRWYKLVPPASRPAMADNCEGVNLRDADCKPDQLWSCRY